MDKMNRKMNPTILEESKQRTMDFVMNEIQQEKSSVSFFKKLLQPVFVPALILILVLVVTLAPGSNPPIDEPITISAYESQKLAEISYITSNFIGSSITVNTTHFRFLNDTDTTEFEDNEDLINLYFDTLRVFLEEDFESSITVTELTEEDEYDYLITFDIDDELYEFYISINEEGVIIGLLAIDTLELTVTGTYEESDTETTFVILAQNGDDFVEIEYKLESEDEIETKYQIRQRINGVETEKEIKLSFEANESKIQIKEGQNEYQLKKEVEDGETQYKLEYNINGTEGEAKIRVNTDSEGNTQYAYQIKEGSTEKEINKGKPDYDHSEKDNGNGNSDDETGNGSEDNGNSDNDGGNGSDQDSGSGSDNNNDGGNGGGQNQSYPEEYAVTPKTL